MLLLRSCRRVAPPMRHASSASASASSAASASASPIDPPGKTCLYDFHVAHGGRMVPFAGYLLPVQYGQDGIAASHRHCRSKAGLFDVSHMQQTYVHGRAATACFESICTADVLGLAIGAGTLTVLTTPDGGIYDDLIVTKVADDRLFVVSNAGRKAVDRRLMLAAVERFSALGEDVRLEFLEPDERALVAVQGPGAVAAVQRVCDRPLDALWFMRSTEAGVAGVPRCRITRCGYTGEDGVEVSIPAGRAQHVVETLLADGDEVRLAGLGARDSLRLEAGLCLYGSDIDESTNPVEAGLAWLVAKRRRVAADFPGAAAILGALAPGGCTRRRVGIRTVNGPPARHDTEVLAADEERVVGHVTSGCPSPSLGGAVAMGYVDEALRTAGTPVRLRIRGKAYEAHVARMPFVPAHYFNAPK